MVNSTRLRSSRTHEEQPSVGEIEDEVRGDLGQGEVESPLGRSGNGHSVVSKSHWEDLRAVNPRDGSPREAVLKEERVGRRSQRLESNPPVRTKIFVREIRY